MAESGDELTNCPLCFEEYTEIGDHVPRILPCSHTVCEKCLEVLIHNNKVDCSECRLKHKAAAGIRSFAQNKYIITHLHRRQSANQKEEKKDDPERRSVPLNKCQEHDREKTLFCREPGCLEPVCPKCLARFHKQHKYVDIEVQREKCEPLLNDIDILQKKLQERMEKLTASREKVEVNKASCLLALNAKKEELIKEVKKKFHTLCEEAEILTRSGSKAIDEDISSICRSVDSLNYLRDSVNSVVMIDDDIAEKTVKVKGMMTLARCFKDVAPIHVTYNEGEGIGEMLERLCGRVTIGTSDVVPQVSSELKQAVPNGPKKILEASDFWFQAIQFISTAWGSLGDLILTSDDGIIVSGEKQGKWKLLIYNLHNLRSSPADLVLWFDPKGLVEVTIRGTRYLALSNEHEERIEFRNSCRPEDILFSCPVTPSVPGVLCRASSSKLLYVDTSCKPNDVCIMCAETGMTGVLVTLKQPYPVCFMIQREFEGKEFIIVSHGNPQAPRGGIYAYNAKSRQLEWSVEGRLLGMSKVLKAQGLTTDERGHLFVCDDNNKCIQMFYVADGRYLGAVIKPKQCGLGDPWAITWSRKMSSLVVNHFIQEKWFLSVFKANVSKNVFD